MYAIYTCLGAIINQLMAPYGYSSGQTGIAGFVFIVAGVAGSAVSGVVLDKTQKYLLTYKLLCLGTLVFALGFIWSLPSKNLLVLCANLFLLGISLLPIIPVGFAFSVELAFPVSEAISNGWIIFWSMILGFVFTYLVTWLVEKDPRWSVLLFGI